MKEFYATAEKVLRVESGNPVVKSVIKDEQLISEKDQVEQAIADYFQEVYSGEDRHMEADTDLALWERLEAAADASLGLFTDSDVVEAIKASNFNKGLGPDGFDGSILKPGDPSHLPTQVLSAQIFGLLNKLMSMPKYLYEGRLVPLS